MRFMSLMIPKGYETAAADTRPDPEHVAAMRKYNNALKEAGVLPSLDGLHPPASGMRVSFPNGKPEVFEGPFPQAEPVIGGYGVIHVKSKDEAVEWATRCPGRENEMIEVRRVFDMEDFSPEVQKTAGHG